MLFVAFVTGARGHANIYSVRLPTRAKERSAQKGPFIASALSAEGGSQHTLRAYAHLECTVLKEVASIRSVASAV